MSIPAAQVFYAARVPTDWRDGYQPGDLDDALDQLAAERVTGPSSATNLRLVVMDGTTGKLIKESGGIVVGGVSLDALSGGSIADAMVNEGNITQHEAAIDHDALTNHEVNQHKEVISALKTSDTDRDTTTTFTDDPDFVLTPSINTNYIVTGMIAIKSGTTPDFKYEFGGPASGASIELFMGGGIAGSNTSKNFLRTSSFNQSRSYLVGNTSFHIMWITGGIFVGSTAGDIAFRWAQNTSSGTNTKVGKGSWLRLEEV